MHRMNQSLKLKLPYFLLLPLGSTNRSKPSKITTLYPRSSLYIHVNYITGMKHEFKVILTCLNMMLSFLISDNDKLSLTSLVQFMYPLY